MHTTNIYTKTVEINELKRITFYRKRCEHNRERSKCKECKGASVCEHNIQRYHCIICSTLPLLACTFPLCEYKTKVSNGFKRHIKSHSPEHIKNKKLEEIKIEKLFLNNRLNYTREHVTSYNCINDISNTHSQVDFVNTPTSMINLVLFSWK